MKMLLSFLLIGALTVPVVVGSAAALTTAEKIQMLRSAEQQRAAAARSGYQEPQSRTQIHHTTKSQSQRTERQISETSVKSASVTPSSTVSVVTHQAAKETVASQTDFVFKQGQVWQSGVYMCEDTPLTLKVFIESVENVQLWEDGRVKTAKINAVFQRGMYDSRHLYRASAQYSAPINKYYDDELQFVPVGSLLHKPLYMHPESDQLYSDTQFETLKLDGGKSAMAGKAFCSVKYQPFLLRPLNNITFDVENEVAEALKINASIEAAREIYLAAEQVKYDAKMGPLHARGLTLPPPFDKISVKEILTKTQIEKLLTEIGCKKVSKFHWTYPADMSPFPSMADKPLEVIYYSATPEEEWRVMAIQFLLVPKQLNSQDSYPEIDAIKQQFMDKYKTPDSSGRVRNGDMQIKWYLDGGKTSAFLAIRGFRGPIIFPSVQVQYRNEELLKKARSE